MLAVFLGSLTAGILVFYLSGSPFYAFGAWLIIGLVFIYKAGNEVGKGKV